MINKQLILPKKDEDGNPYLSYSQISTWKKNKRDYMRQYFHGEKFTGNDYTEFGTKVGEALENNDFSEFNTVEKKFLGTIPRYDQFERKIKLQMKGFYVVGYIDSNDLDKKGIVKNILDYKTGDISTKVAEYEDEKYTQLHIYSAAIMQEQGTLPKTAKVVLIDRTGNAFKGEKLKLGKEYTTIIKDVTVESVSKVMDGIQETALEISAYYQTYLKMIKDESK